MITEKLMHEGYIVGANISTSQKGGKGMSLKVEKMQNKCEQKKYEVRGFAQDTQNPIMRVPERTKIRQEEVIR